MAELYLDDAAGELDERALSRLGTFLNWIGALMSVGLIAGLTLWGYQLAVRDVSGVPVVLALEGPMRVAPDDPGGEQAAHQGLAVNSVAAVGVAAPPPDRLVLAPPPLALNDEDLPRPSLAEVTPAPRPESVGTGDGEAADLLTEVAEAADTLEAVPENVTPLSAPIDPAASAIPASVKGVARSPRPRPRPAEVLASRAVVSDAPLAPATTASVEVDAATLPPGTRLVQFGAFDSAEAARVEWALLDAKFADFLADKKRVVQRAASGGKSFYRLRAVGFSDINDARRFCSAFLAERQPCIPVVSR